MEAYGPNGGRSSVRLRERFAFGIRIRARQISLINDHTALVLAIIHIFVSHRRTADVFVYSYTTRLSPPSARALSRR